MTIQCFHCEKVLKPVFNDGEGESVQPYEGLIFTSSGNYGSTVYDPVRAAPRIVIVICDQCMIERRAFGFARAETRPTVDVTYGPLDLAALPE